MRYKAQSWSPKRTVCVAWVPHCLNGKPWIVEGYGSAGRHSNVHRDFYHNSGFHADGSLDEAHVARLAAVVEACDRLGTACLIQLFCFGQDTVFEGEERICAAVDTMVDWVCTQGYCNVILEIANEVMEGHYHHALLKPGRVAELIHRARKRAHEVHGWRLLVSTSEAALLSERQWTADQIDAVKSACDLLIVHGGDNVETDKVGDASDLMRKVEYLRARPWYNAVRRLSSVVHPERKPRHESSRPRIRRQAGDPRGRAA